MGFIWITFLLLNVAMEALAHLVQWFTVATLNMVMFNSYVELPEANGYPLVI